MGTAYLFIRNSAQNETRGARFAVNAWAIPASAGKRKGAVSEYCALYEKTLKQPTSVDSSYRDSVQTSAKQTAEQHEGAAQ